MKVRVTLQQQGMVVDLIGRLTAATDDGCLERLSRLVGKQRVRRLVLNLAELERIDCSGVGRLVQIRRSCAEAGAALEVTNVDRRVYRILEITRVAGVLGASMRPEPALRASSALMLALLSLAGAVASVEAAQQQEAVASPETVAVPLTAISMVPLTERVRQTMTREVTRIFEAAGVPVRFLTLDEADTATSRCKFLVRVLIRDAEPLSWNLPGETMGVTIDPQAPPGSIYLFHPAIVRNLGISDPRSGATSDERLGRALAYITVHELVHAFAPDHPHTGWGIMGYIQDAASLTQAGRTLDRSAARALRQGWHRARLAC